MKLNKEQKEILDHTLHRAANGLYCGDSKDMQILVKLGLMVCVGKKSFVPEEYYQITGAGRKAFRDASKIGASFYKRTNQLLEGPKLHKGVFCR